MLWCHHTHCWLCMCCLYCLDIGGGLKWSTYRQCLICEFIFVFLFFIVFGCQNHHFRSLCNCSNNSNIFVIIIVQELLRNNPTKELLCNYGMIKNKRRRISWIIIPVVLGCVLSHPTEWTETEWEWEVSGGGVDSWPVWSPESAPKLVLAALIKLIISLLPSPTNPDTRAAGALVRQPGPSSPTAVPLLPSFSLCSYQS